MAQLQVKSLDFMHTLVMIQNEIDVNADSIN